MKNQCQSTGTYCGHDQRKLAGTVPPCPVCAPHMATHRQNAGMKPQPSRPARKPKPSATAAEQELGA